MCENIAVCMANSEDPDPICPNAYGYYGSLDHLWNRFSIDTAKYLTSVF